MRANAQAEKFNRSGRARTRDDLMVTSKPVPDDNPRSKKGRGATARAKRARKGRSGWKKWTGEAICQAAYAPPSNTSRNRAIAEGASHGHVQGTEMFNAEMVLSTQNEVNILQTI